MKETHSQRSRKPYGGETIRFFFADCKGLISDPRETFRRITTYESLRAPAIMIFLCGAIDGIKRFSAVANIGTEQAKIMLPYQIGLLASDRIMAFLTPFFLLGSWILAAYVANAVADRVGARKGDFATLLMTIGYLSIPMLACSIVSFFLTGLARFVPLFKSLDTIVLIAFVIWLFYLWTVMISEICGLEMMHAGITAAITIIVVGFVYYTLFELLLRSILANIFARRV